MHDRRDVARYTQIDHHNARYNDARYNIARYNNARYNNAHEYNNARYNTIRHDTIYVILHCRGARAIIGRTRRCTLANAALEMGIGRSARSFVGLA